MQLCGMLYNKMVQADIDYLVLVAGVQYVHTDTEQRLRCASDQTEDLQYMPEVVVQPGTTLEVSRIMAYCNEHLLPVTPRGAGTGLSGGALPVKGGVVLDMKRFDKVLHVDKRNFQVTTEPGVITQVLQEQLKAEGLFYPGSFRVQEMGQVPEAVLEVLSGQRYWSAGLF